MGGWRHQGTNVCGRGRGWIPLTRCTTYYLARRHGAHSRMTLRPVHLARCAALEAIKVIQNDCPLNPTCTCWRGGLKSFVCSMPIKLQFTKRRRGYLYRLPSDGLAFLDGVPLIICV